MMSTIEAREFLKRPYTRILIPDEESGTFTAQIVEFPGCIAQGANPAEAYERLESAAESWIEAALEMQQEIPSPASDIQFSGRFALRIPRGLHRQAAQLAELEETSLNQFIASAIAEKVGAVGLYRNLAQQLQVAMASTVLNAQAAHGPIKAPVLGVRANAPLKMGLVSSLGPNMLGLKDH
jgi:predicted RNase H-like HicB family nuclease